MLARKLSEHTLTVAKSGEQALAAFATNDSFEVVLCDLMMPNITGMEVYSRVESEWPELTQRFIFMTGGVFTEEAARFVDEHRVRCVEKPFDLVHLHDLLYEVAASRTPRAE